LKANQTVIALFRDYFLRSQSIPEVAVDILPFGDYTWCSYLAGLQAGSKRIVVVYRE
jgi:hypothetical protein